MSEDIDSRKIREDYYNLLKECPLTMDEIIDKQLLIRDNLNEDYGLINFMNRPLYIDNNYIGMFNSIVGSKKNIQKIYDTLKKYLNCYYRVDNQKPSEAYIIFPYNVDVEIIRYLDKLKI